MTKGTASFGRQSGKKTHIPCRRCGQRSYHVRKHRCAYCGFGERTTMRRYNWTTKLPNHATRKPQRSPKVWRKALRKSQRKAV